MTYIRLGRDEDFQKVRDFLDKQIAFKSDGFIGDRRLRYYLQRDRTYVALEGEEIVGVAIHSKKKTLYNLIVDETRRGQGIGTKLLQAVNPDYIRCKVNVSSGNPIPFYQKHGYGFVGVVRDGQSSPHKKTKQKSIQVMVKGGKIPPLEEYT